MKYTGLRTRGQQNHHDHLVPIHLVENKSITQELCEFFQTKIDKFKEQLVDVTVMKYLPKLKGG